MLVGLKLAQRRDDSTDVESTYVDVWATCSQPNQHTTKPLGCVQHGGVQLGYVQFG